MINPAFLSLIEPFSYAYFAAGNISVGFTPTNKLGRFRDLNAAK
jgi:hypothetical protein